MPAAYAKAEPIRCSVKGIRVRALCLSAKPLEDMRICRDAPLWAPLANCSMSFLWHAHLRREEVFIANVLKCRPPSNRNPSASEIEACAPFFAYASADNQPVATHNHGQFCHPVHPENRHGVSHLRGTVRQTGRFWWRRCITLPQLFMTPHAWKRSWPISNESAALCMIE